MHHRLTVRDLSNRPLILEVDSLIRQPLLRVKPLGVVPCRRIAAMHSDKDDPSRGRRNIEGRKIGGDLCGRIYALEGGCLPRGAKRQTRTDGLATHGSAQHKQQTRKRDIVEMTGHQFGWITACYKSSDKSLQIEQQHVSAH